MKKFMKKSVVFLALLAMVIGMLAGCAGNENPSTGSHIRHVDANKDGVCDECGANVSVAPGTTVSTAPSGNNDPVTPGDTTAGPGVGENTDGPDVWDTTAQYIFTHSSDNTRTSLLYLFPNGVAKFMPTRYYEEYYTGTWNVVDGTLTIVMNANHDQLILDGNEANPTAHEVAVKDGVYSLSITSTRGEVLGLEYKGEIKAPANPSAPSNPPTPSNPSNPSTPSDPSNDWSKDAVYTFVDDAANVRAALYLLAGGEAKLLPRTNRPTSLCSGTWSMDEATKTITLSMDKTSDDDEANNGIASDMASYTIELSGNTYTVTITYGRASQVGERIEETVTVSCTVSGSAPSNPGTENDVDKTILFINRTEKTENDVKLGGYQYLPVGENLGAKLPTIIMSHGLNNSADRFDDLANYFAQNGYAVFAFNFAGGSQPKDKNAASSGINSKDCTVLTEVRDLNAIMDYVKTLDFVDTDNLFLFGQSQGGWISTYVAGERASEVKGLLCYFPAYSIREDCETGRNDSKSEAYRNDALSVDIYEYLGKYAGTDQANKKVIICHGDSDTTVDIRHSEKAQTMYPENVTLYTIAGAGHGFNRDQAQITATNGYCLAYLKEHTN